MFKNHYVFPSIISYDEDGISVEFPDLPGCYTCADNTETAISRAQEALALHISSMEDDNEDIPSPSSIDSIQLVKSQAIILIDVWMPVYRDKIKYASVKKY